MKMKRIYTKNHQEFSCFKKSLRAVGVQQNLGVKNAVEEICENIRKYGNTAMEYYTRKLDLGRNDGTLQEFIKKCEVFRRIEVAGLLKKDWREFITFIYPQKGKVDIIDFIDELLKAVKLKPEED